MAAAAAAVDSKTDIVHVTVKTLTGSIWPIAARTVAELKLILRANAYRNEKCSHVISNGKILKDNDLLTKDQTIIATFASDKPKPITITASWMGNQQFTDAYNPSQTFGSLLSKACRYFGLHPANCFLTTANGHFTGAGTQLLADLNLQPGQSLQIRLRNPFGGKSYDELSASERKSYEGSYDRKHESAAGAAASAAKGLIPVNDAIKTCVKARPSDRNVCVACLTNVGNGCSASCNCGGVYCYKCFTDLKKKTGDVPSRCPACNTEATGWNFHAIKE
jgi:hypothetical protein